jgi:hypothetical protein
MDVSAGDIVTANVNPILLDNSIKRVYKQKRA